MTCTLSVPVGVGSVGFRRAESECLAARGLTDHLWWAQRSDLGYDRW